MKNWILVLVAIVLVTAGCRSAPIYNVTDSPIVVTSGKVASADEVKMAIMRAGTKLGWQMTEAQPGVVAARIALRGNTAHADVLYNTKTYSIVYRDSSGLETPDGQIHKNYNGWIENLDRGIRTELLRQ